MRRSRWWGKALLHVGLVCPQMPRRCSRGAAAANAAAAQRQRCDSEAGGGTTWRAPMGARLLVGYYCTLGAKAPAGAPDLEHLSARAPMQRRTLVTPQQRTREAANSVPLTVVWRLCRSYSERFNSHANYPMLAQATTHDNYTRGVRSRAATGSNPQASFALAHVPTRP
jgi:hypothetical protein